MPVKQRYVLTHPDNVMLLRQTLQPFDDRAMLAGRLECSLPIVECKHLEKTKPGPVQFPKWPFVEWEKKDEGWALRCGIAKQEQEPLFYIVEEQPSPLDLEFFSPPRYVQEPPLLLSQRFLLTRFA